MSMNGAQKYGCEYLSLSVSCALRKAVARPEPSLRCSYQFSISSAVVSSCTSHKLATSVVAPAPRNARVRPMSSSPAKTSLRPDSQALKVTRAPARSSRITSLAASQPSPTFNDENMGCLPETCRDRPDARRRNQAPSNAASPQWPAGLPAARQQGGAERRLASPLPRPVSTGRPRQPQGPCRILVGFASGRASKPSHSERRRLRIAPKDTIRHRIERGTAPDAADRGARSRVCATLRFCQRSGPRFPSRAALATLSAPRRAKSGLVASTARATSCAALRTPYPPPTDPTARRAAAQDVRLSPPSQCSARPGCLLAPEETPRSHRLPGGRLATSRRTGDDPSYPTPLEGRICLTLRKRASAAGLSPFRARWPAPADLGGASRAHCRRCPQTFECKSRLGPTADRGSAPPEHHLRLLPIPLRLR